MAVELQAGEVEVAVLVQVHLQAVHDLVQPRLGYTERIESRRERPRHRMLRVAAEELRHLVPPPAEGHARGRSIARLVDGVVDLAAERVQRGDGAPALWREEQERVIEARAALRCFLPAVFVWRHRASTARPKMSGQSNAVSTGRCRKTSPRALSSLSRILNPPCTTARISRPMRPGRRRASGAPASISARARSIWNRIRLHQPPEASRAAICDSLTPNRAISSCGR